MKKIQVESNTIFFRVFKFNLSHFESGKEKLFQLEIHLLYLSVKLRLLKTRSLRTVMFILYTSCLCMHVMTKIEHVWSLSGREFMAPTTKHKFYRHYQTALKNKYNLNITYNYWNTELKTLSLRRSSKFSFVSFLQWKFIHWGCFPINLLQRVNAYVYSVECYTFKYITVSLYSTTKLLSSLHQSCLQKFSPRTSNAM